MILSHNACTDAPSLACFNPMMGGTPLVFLSPSGAGIAVRVNR